MITERFKVIEKLSSDEKRKFSSVYKCLDLSTSKNVTCKVIDKSRISSEIELQRVQREGRFNFKHPGIPKLIDFIQTDDSYIIVRDFVEGITLDKYKSFFWRPSKRNKFISNFFIQAGELLIALHKQGIYHCDVKLSNFILSPSGKLSLIDFGLVQFKNDILTGKTLFAMGYSPPEIILNHLHLINHQSDYFSLGVCLWELFSGELPLHHEHPAYMINLQITHPIPDNRRIPKNWKKTIQKLTKKHQFGKPPNQIPFLERDENLTEGRNLRPNEIEFQALVNSSQ